MRHIAIIAWLTLILTAIALLFWYNEWVYALPTVVPAKYKNITPGAEIENVQQLKANKTQPLFLHFFNPDCPCSRFNIPHFKSLVKQCGNRVNFAMVLMSKKKFTVEEIQHKYDLNIPVYFDSSIAKECGVYSTPQAVLIDVNNTMYYRGNYNKSRYCTNKKTNYAQIAIDSLLNNNYNIVFDQFAVKAYGCQLTNCYK